MKIFFVLSLCLIICSLRTQAADTKATSTVNRLVATEMHYLGSDYRYVLCSSPKFLVFGEDTIYSNGLRCAEQGADLYKEFNSCFWGLQVGVILLDKYLATAQDLKEGIQIHDLKETAPYGYAAVTSNKIIKIPIVQSSDVVRNFCAIPHDDMAVLFHGKASLKRAIVMDLVMEKMKNSYTSELDMGDIVPDNTGNGSWYCALKNDQEESNSIKHFDFRTNKATMAIKTQGWNFCVSPDNAHCAGLSDKSMDIFNVKTQKCEKTIKVDFCDKKHKPFFVGNDAVMYACKKEGWKNKGLERASLVADTKVSYEFDEPVSLFYYLYNTRLLVGYVGRSEVSVYDLASITQ